MDETELVYECVETECSNVVVIDEHVVEEVTNESDIGMEIHTVVTEEDVYMDSMHCEIVTEIIEQDPTLTVGSRFYDYQSFENALNLYSLANNLVYTIQKSARISRKNKIRREKNYKLYNPKLKYSSLVMGCKHYGAKRSRNRGIRPKQSTYKTGCNSQIVLGLDSTTQSLVITRFITEHNHDVSLDVAENYPERRRLSMEETLFMEERLRDPCLKAKQVQAIVRSTLHKHVSSKDVHNFRASLKRPRKEPPVIEEIDEDEILKPGEPPIPRNVGPKKPRIRKPKVIREATSESTEPKQPRPKRSSMLRKVNKASELEPEDAEFLVGDVEEQREEDDPDWVEGEVAAGEIILDTTISVKEEAESNGDEEDHYECVEYLEPDFADDGGGDCVDAGPKSIAAVNESWKCVYKLLEADNAALKRDVEKLREQLAAIKQSPCAQCGSIARK